MTSNEFYGALNKRFDERAELLRRNGFRYECLKEYNIAVFVRRQPGFKPETIQSGTVTCACDRLWSDVLSQYNIQA